MEWFGARRRRAFVYPDSVIDRKMRQFLHQAAWPADGRFHKLRCAETEEHIFAVLREESGTCLQPACLASGFCFDSNGRANGVPIAFDAAQAERDGRRQIWKNVLQEPQLRTVAILQEHFLAAIVIEVGQSERSSVLDKVQIHGA